MYTFTHPRASRDPMMMERHTKVVVVFVASDFYVCCRRCDDLYSFCTFHTRPRKPFIVTFFEASMSMFGCAEEMSAVA
jgi:hypothetical protein